MAAPLWQKYLTFVSGALIGQNPASATGEALSTNQITANRKKYQPHLFGITTSLSRYKSRFLGVKALKNKNNARIIIHSPFVKT